MKDCRSWLWSSQQPSELRKGDLFVNREAEGTGGDCGAKKRERRGSRGPWPTLLVPVT